MTLLNPYNFIFEQPLYQEIEITDINKSDFYALMHFYGKFDAYNPSLKQESTYQVIPPFRSSGDRKYLENYKGYNEFTITCVRNNYQIKCYVLLYNIEEENENEDEDDIKKYFFLKIGQFPSIADLHISKIRNYDKVLNKEQMREFTRAIGLAANGVGIGSFVYLRRIFEHLINQAHDLAVKDTDWNEVEFLKNRMVERIQLLKDHLPQFLVDNKTMYGILSLGIHELTEQECLKHFEALKVGIEFILDEKVEQLNRAKKIQEAQQKIKAIEQQITKP